MVGKCMVCSTAFRNPIIGGPMYGTWVNTEKASPRADGVRIPQKPQSAQARRATGMLGPRMNSRAAADTESTMAGAEPRRRPEESPARVHRCDEIVTAANSRAHTSPAVTAME